MLKRQLNMINGWQDNIRPSQLFAARDMSWISLCCTQMDKHGNFIIVSRFGSIKSSATRPWDKSSRCVVIVSRS